MLPTLADGTPLCLLDELRRRARTPGSSSGSTTPPSPRRIAINAVAARARARAGCSATAARSRPSGSSRRRSRSSTRRPRSTTRADRLIEAADWVVWQLTGVETRNTCTAGYKAMWSKREGFPADAYFAALDPRFEHVVDEKMSRQHPADRQPRRRAERAGGGLDGPAAGHGGRGRERRRPRLGAGGDRDRAGDDGRDHGHEHLPHGPRRRARDRRRDVRRRRGRRRARALRLRGRPVGRGRHLRLVRRELPSRPSTTSWPDAGARASTKCSSEEAAKLRPGESGLLALDWWNGNRSVLVDADLRGLLVGMTLATRAPEIYRALIEATAFGTRVIIEAFESAGVPRRRNRRLRRPARAEQAADADLRRRHRSRVRRRGLRADAGARLGDVRRRGGRRRTRAATTRSWTRRDHMAHLGGESYRPIAAHRAVYDELYREYLRLHDLFGRGGDDVMRNLKRIQRRSSRGRPLRLVVRGDRADHDKDCRSGRRRTAASSIFTP